MTDNGRSAEAHGQTPAAAYTYGGFALIGAIILSVFLIKTSVLPHVAFVETGPAPLDKSPAASFLVNGYVDVNKAGAADFELLPGIGKALAARIVEKRDELGGFKKIEDITGVKGIGKVKFEEIRKYLRVETP